MGDHLVTKEAAKKEAIENAQAAPPSPQKGAQTADQLPQVELSHTSSPSSVTIKKSSLLASLFRPVSLAIAALVLIYGLGTFGTNYWQSFQRHLTHSKAVHPDRTIVEIAIRSSLPRFDVDAVQLVIRDANGKLRRVVTSRQQHHQFVADTLALIETERARIKAAANRDLDQLFERSFKDRDAAIAAYADWFFEWKRSYIVLKETLASAANRFFKLGEYESLKVAVERDIKDYFMRHYQAQVLKPEQRDHLITAGLETTVRRAHEGYRRLIALGDKRLQTFLAQHTAHLEDIKPGEKITRLALDWDAQKWKAPVYLMEDRAFDGVAGLGTAVAGGTIGALALGPIMNQAMAQAFGGLSRQFAASMGTRLALAEGGAVAGTAVNPLGGQIVGLAVGVALGLAADYVINRANAHFSRDQFIAANQTALDTTITTWRHKLKSSVFAAIDRWFDDARTGVLSLNVNIDSKSSHSMS